MPVRDKIEICIMFLWVDTHVSVSWYTGILSTTVCCQHETTNCNQIVKITRHFIYPYGGNTSKALNSLDESNIKQMEQLEDVGLELEGAACHWHDLEPVTVANLLKNTDKLSVYRKISNISCTKSRNSNDSHLVLQLSPPSLLKPGVKSRMKM